MTSSEYETHMTILVHNFFKQSRTDKILLFDHQQEFASPEIIRASFDKDALVNSFVSGGMLDKNLNICVDIHGIIDSFKVTWHEGEGGKMWFMKQLPGLINEMFQHGEVNEKYYNEHNLPLDKDHDGNI